MIVMFLVIMILGINKSWPTWHPILKFSKNRVNISSHCFLFKTCKLQVCNPITADLQKQVKHFPSQQFPTNLARSARCSKYFVWWKRCLKVFFPFGLSKKALCLTKRSGWQALISLLIGEAYRHIHNYFKTSKSRQMQRQKGFRRFFKEH